MSALSSTTRMVRTCLPSRSSNCLIWSFEIGLLRYSATPNADARSSHPGAVQTAIGVLIPLSVEWPSVSQVRLDDGAVMTIPWIDCSSASFWARSVSGTWTTR
jgi:hypothetical protein